MKILLFILFILTKYINNQPFGGDESLPIIREICKIADIDYTKIPKANSVQDFLDNIDYNLEEKRNNSIDSYLDKLFIEGDLTKESNPSEKYLFKITDKYIFNRGVLTLSLFWIGLIISLILGKCIFSQKTSSTNLFAKKYINMGQFIFIIILALNCIPLLYSRRFLRAFNAASCSLVRFLQEVKFGNSTYNEDRIFLKPYTWLGLLNIDNILLDIQNFFNKTGFNRKEVFDGISEMKKNITDFGKLFENLELFFKNSSIVFYNRKIQPLYIQEFSNIDKKGSKIYNIYEQYQVPLEKNFKYMLNINDTATLFEKRNLGYTKNLESVFNETNRFSKLITQKSINITHNIQFLHEKAFKYIYKYFVYSYYFNIIASIFLSLFMFEFCKKRKNRFKIFLHFGWNICMLIILVSFIVSYFVLSVGESFSDLIYIIHDTILKVDQNGFFNTCLNKKGNLLGLMELEQVRNFAELNDFYHLIIRQDNLIKNLEKSELIKGYLEEIQKLKVDISLTTNEDFKFIDINHLLIRLSNITGDFWVSDRFSCKKYRYLNKDVILDIDRNNLNNSNYCLTVQDKYSEEELRKVYKNKDEGKIYEIVTIVTNLNSYYEQNEIFLANLELLLNKIDQTYYNLMNQINEKSNSIHALVDLYLSLFPDMNEKDSISDFFNCEILKEELIAYYNFNYNYVYFYCKLFGIISLAIGLLTFVGMILIINSIQWIDYEEYTKNREESSEEEQELDEIIEEYDEDFGDEDYYEKNNNNKHI